MLLKSVTLDDLNNSNNRYFKFAACHLCISWEWLLLLAHQFSRFIGAYLEFRVSLSLPVLPLICTAGWTTV